MSIRALRSAALAALVAASSAVPADAVRRPVRTLGVEDGLPSAWVTDVAQDTDGFLWIATSGALVRYDGARMRHWAPETLASRWIDVASGPRGEVVARLEDGSAFTVVPDGAEPLAGPAGATFRDVQDLAFGGDGALWAVAGAAVHRRDGAGAWTTLPAATLGDEAPRYVRAAQGGAFLVTSGGVWRLTPELAATRLATLERLQRAGGVPDGIVDVVERGDEVVVLLWQGAVVSLVDGEPRKLFALPGRGIDLELRGETVWAAFDRYLAALPGSGVPEVTGPEDDLPSGGPLLVDRERSLWMGTFTGLLQLPEPDALQFGEEDGLPSDHVRSLAAGDDGVWVSTWQGTGRIAREDGGWSVATVPEAKTQGRLCAGGDGAIWAAADGRLLEIRAGSVRAHPAPGARVVGQCATGAGGRIWLPVPAGLYLVEPGRAPRAVTDEGAWDTAGDGAEVRAALETRDGRLFVAVDDRVCEAAAAAVAGGGAPPWRCQRLPDAMVVGSLIEAPSGDVWLASERTGVHRLRAGRWEPIGEPARRVGILALEPADAGGVWVLGGGRLERVVERRESPLGWEVVERISGGHGLETGSASDVLEMPSGDLWVATTRGVARIPAAGRRRALPAPAVHIVGATAAGSPLPVPGAGKVPYRRRQIQLDFAALAFRDPASLRYRVRTGAAGAWEEMRGAATIRFLDLAPGDYRAEVQASLDGSRWSDEPAIYAFTIAPPWHGTWWARGAGVAALAALLAAAYRARVRHLVELERQRSRIAMDLHDELGSGLGSVGILAGVLSRDGLDPAERRAVAERISRTASELGAALSEIVWSLRPGPRDLRQLAVHLAEHGNRLFADDEVRFATDFPAAWPAHPLSAAVRRNVLLVALEALHNARRHAGASRVTLTLAPRGRRWRLRVADDGRGLPGDVGEAGLGLLGMDRRAAEIGADLSIETAAGGGTAVELVFSPRARSRPPRGERPSGRPIVRQTGAAGGARLGPSR